MATPLFDYSSKNTRVAVVDSIRHADGRLTLRSLTEQQASDQLGSTLTVRDGATSILHPNVITKLSAWLAITENSFTEGSVRVTFISGRWFPHTKAISEIVWSSKFHEHHTRPLRVQS